MKQIPGFDNYFMSSDLQIYKKLVNRLKKINFSIPKSGYKTVKLRKNGKEHSLLLHRLIAICYIGHPPKDKPFVCHNNGNKLDNRIENLRWDNQTGNMKDCIFHGTRACTKGENNGRHKLSNTDIKKILTLYSTGKYSQPKLGKLFKVCKSTIGNIVRKESWKHV
jgi:hypothetical protein